MLPPTAPAPKTQTLISNPVLIFLSGRQLPHDLIDVREALSASPIGEIAHPRPAYGILVAITMRW
jgi:hypothetical protein